MTAPVPVVCVPDESLAAPLRGCGAAVVAAAEPPADTAFLVPSYLIGTPAAAALAALPVLRVIQLLSAGYERWQALVPPGVTLCNGRGVHGASTAEIAVGGLIAVLRDLPRYARQQHEAQWRPDYGQDGLDGGRVLVVGAGDIGAKVAAAVTALGADVTLVGRTARDGVRGIAELPSLLSRQRAVVLAVPLAPQTHHLVDAAFLAALPDGAVVVNVARGPVLDTGALLAELVSGRLRAFLDVTDPEPLPPEHPLWRAPNLLLTPHVGGGASGWQPRAVALLRDQVARFLSGAPLRNVV